METTSVEQIEKLDIHACRVNKGYVLVFTIPSSVIHIDGRFECYSGKPFLNRLM